jgi:hypothetical protein
MDKRLKRKTQNCKATRRKYKGKASHQIVQAIISWIRTGNNSKTEKCNCIKLNHISIAKETIE